MTDMTSSSTWDMSQERAFVENLFCQRINFLIIIFSLVIAAAAAANSQLMLRGVLSVGLVLSVLVALTVYRNFVKLIWILRTLHEDPNHPIAVTQKGIESLGWRRLFGVNHILGIWIPAFCCGVLALGLYLAYAEILKVN